MQRIKKIALLTFFCLIFALMLFISLILVRGDMEHPGYRTEFEEEFALSVNGVFYGHFTMDDLPKFTVNPQDEVEISLRLPKAEIYDPVFVCDLSYAAVEAFVDGEKIYSHGITEGRADREVGASYHKMHLPEDFGGKELRLRLLGLEKYNFPFLLRRIFLCQDHNIAIPIVRRHLFAFLTSVTLILFGILLLVIFLILYFIDVRAKGLAPLALLSFSVGLWALCDIEFVRIFSDDLLINNYICYFSFYFALLPWIVMVEDLKRQSRYIRILRTFRYLHLLFLALVVSSQLAGWINYKSFTLPYAGLFLVCIAFGLYMMGKDRKEQKLYEKILFFGNLIPACYVGAQMLVFNLDKFFSISLKVDAGNLYLSLLMVIATFSAAYGLRFSEAIVSRREVELLQKMAYEDPLTELENRQGAILCLLDLDAGRKGYQVVVLDLNDLKKVNDLYGHNVGDQMIVSFAGCLRSAFPETAVLCRWGGDEFLVILPTEEERIAEEALQNLRQCIGRVNKEDRRGILLQSAYGVASTKEGFGFDYEKIIHSADEKMYRHKKEMKNRDSVGSLCHE